MAIQTYTYKIVQLAVNDLIGSWDSHAMKGPPDAPDLVRACEKAKRTLGAQNAAPTIPDRGSFDRRIAALHIPLEQVQAMPRWWWNALDLNHHRLRDDQIRFRFECALAGSFPPMPQAWIERFEKGVEIQTREDFMPRCQRLGYPATVMSRIGVMQWRFLMDKHQILTDEDLEAELEQMRQIAA